MTALLLTLASLTPGDGGPGGGAAREAVAMTPGEGFTGFIRVPGGALCGVEQRDGNLAISRPWCTANFRGGSLAPEGDGRFRLTWAGATFKGTVAVGRAGTILTLDRPAGKVDPPRWRSFTFVLEMDPPKRSRPARP